MASGTAFLAHPGSRQRESALTCSIIIPVFNHASVTRQCLNALLRDLSDAVEVIVVDDGSTDTTPEVLSTYGDRVRVVTHEQNLGFAYACNAGAAASSSPFVVFLNNDTLPVDGWLDALIAYGQSHERAAVVGSKLSFPNDTIQHAGVVICQDRVPRHIYVGFPAYHPAVNKSRRFQIVTAASALVRRDAFEEVGRFDTTFSNGYEDVDLCLRLAERGHEIHYCCDSSIYHLEMVTRGDRSNEPNHDLYMRRWGPRVQPDDFDYYLEDGLIQVSYPDYFPLGMSVSPLLATITANGRDRATDQLLALRSRQVFETQRENIQLKLRLEARTVAP
jgi:GT2 family glycosyltransferase